MELIPKETFVQWMEILKTVVEQEMPGTYYLFWIQRFSENFINYQNFKRKFYMTVHTALELVSKELNPLAAILHVYAGGLIFMK